MRNKAAWPASLLLVSLCLSAAAIAQTDVLIEEILVTATKRAGGISVQDAGVAITAFDENQLDAMFIRDLKAIGFSAPSVQLEDIGTTRGTANFSIRGLGINSSIPSIDPTVGVFVDGMYLGVNSGVVLDIFDLEGIEVLRGPQGLLFGRNVTGGAVLLRTTKPAQQFSLNARLATETGSNHYGSAIISGPFSDSVRGKLAVYGNDDGGWHTNLANNNDNFGKARTTMVRGALDFDLGDTASLLISAEAGDSSGDGPASQNAGLYSTDSFDFAIDNEGSYDVDWRHAIATLTWDVGPGDGQIVNILGWREYNSLTNSDIDATQLFFFHAPASLKQDQWSNELRYSGSIGDRLYLTTGLYYFAQNMEYREQRLIPPANLDITGGGDQEQSTAAIFGQLDVALTDAFTLNLGLRYTEETKDGKVSTIFLNQCTLNGGCNFYDFQDKYTWTSTTPKIGVQFTPDDDTQWYAFWTKGFRSGGYNMRHTAVAIPNERFDQEEQNSYEVGLKKDMADNRVRLNAALFYNTIDDLQRELNVADPVVGVQQLIRNTADARITGADLEFSWAMTDAWFLQASVGYVDGSYTEVRADLNGDGAIDDKDKALELPRLAPWSYGAELIYTRDFNWGSFTAQGGGYHRDRSAYTDSNLGWLRASDMFSASVGAVFLDNRLRVSIFGRNLQNESTIGGDTQLPANFPGSPVFPVAPFRGTGATFSPLNKGRTYGIELQYTM
jgi:iron complex outermembrane receptor protein